MLKSACWLKSLHQTFSMDIYPSYFHLIYTNVNFLNPLIHLFYFILTWYLSLPIIRLELMKRGAPQASQKTVYLTFEIEKL